MKLTREEINALVNSQAPVNDIIVACIPLALHMLKKARVKRPNTRDDLHGIIMLSLVKAVHRYVAFDVKHYDIVAYLFATLRGELKRNSHSQGMIIVPTTVYFNRLKEIELARLEGRTHNMSPNYVAYNDQVAKDNSELTLIDWEEELHTVIHKEKILQIIDLTVKGYKPGEIAEHMCCTAGNIRNYLSGIRHVILNRKIDLECGRTKKPSKRIQSTG